MASPIVGITLGRPPKPGDPRGTSEIQNLGLQLFTSALGIVQNITLDQGLTYYDVIVLTLHGTFTLYNIPQDETKSTPESWYTLNFSTNPFGWSHLSKNTDQLNIGTTYTDVTGLTVSVAAGQRIRFRGNLVVRTSATTIAANAAINGPAGTMCYSVTEPTNATTGRTVRTCVAYDSVVGVTTAGPGNTSSLLLIEGFVSFSAPGTFALRVKAEASGTMSVLDGSWLEYDLE